GVSGGWASQFPQSIMAVHRHRHRHPTCLETSRGIRAFLLQESIWVTAASNHWRPPFTKRHRVHVGKNSAIPPHSAPVRDSTRTRNFLTLRASLQSRQFVAHIE